MSSDRHGIDQLSPAEQARRDVEAWANTLPAVQYTAFIPNVLEGLIARLTPVYERAQDAKELGRNYDSTLYWFNHWKDKAERAEAERDALQKRNDLLELSYGIDQAHIQQAEADVARLREALQAVVRIADRETIEFAAARDALAATAGGTER